MANLLDQASIVLTPTAYDNGKVLCAKPSEPPYGDFDFSRNSAATRVNAQGLVENVQILSSNLVQNGDFSEEGVEEVSNGSFSQEGVELVTNGDFATDSNWNKGSGWSISGGKATSDGTQVSASYLSQTLSGISQGKQYITEFDIDVISGSFRFNTLGNNLIVTESGHYVIYSTSVSGITLYLEAQVGFTGSIDNCSVREVGQDWTLGTGWSIGEDKAIATSTANSISMYQNNTVEVGKTYKVTYTVADYVEGGIYVRVGSGVNGVVRFGNGTYTEYITQAGDNKLYLTTYTTTTLSITNISVKEVGQDWNLGSGTTIGDGIANITQSGGVLSQSGGILVSGKSFKITFTISNYVSGSIAVSNLTPTTYRSGNGTYTLNAVGAGGDFIFYSSSFIGSVTNISVIEISSDTNLPRINYEGFSYQDALGSELVTNGGFEDGLTDWTAYAGTISIETNIVHSGTQSAKVDGVGIQQSRSYTDGEQVYYNFWVYSTTGTSVFIQTINENVTIPLNQWVQVSGIGTINGNNSSFRIRIANGLWYIDNVSVKEYLGQEVVPDSGCGSWLFEPQSTNIIEYSEDFSNSYWAKSGTVVISDAAVSPDGTLNADKLNFTASNGEIVKTMTFISGQTYTMSFYAKTESGTLDFIYGNMDYSTISGTATNEWQRFVITQTLPTTTRYPKIQTTEIGSLLLWGFQVEQQTYATSYIPTSGSTVTRNQDVCNNGGSLATINSTEGVLYAEIAALSNDGGLRLLQLSDGTNTNRVSLYYDTAINTIYSNVVVNGVANPLSSSVDILNFIKVAVTWKENHFSLWINGLKASEDTSGSTFSSNTLNDLSLSLNGLYPFFGKTKALAVWKEALSDQELADLTYPTPTDPTFSLDFDTIAEQFTFARGSEATYVDAQGLIQSTNEIGPELITNGDFSNGTTGWAFAGGWSVVNNQATTLGVSLTPIRQTVLVNGTNRLTFDIVQGGAFVYTNYPIFSKKAAFTTVGTHTIDLLSDGIGDNRFLYIYNNGAGNSATIDNVSVKEHITATNTPRLDYSTGAEAFLLEPQSTNLITYSEDFSQSYWNKSNVAIDFGYLSPEGNDNAYRVEHLAQYSVLRRLSTLPAGNTTLSVWLKRIDGNSNYNFYGGGGSKSITITDEWKRYDFSFVADGTNNTFFGIQDPNPSGFGSYYVYGAQVEQKSFATSYIPTNGSQTTRNQETCINATPEINSEEGVLYAEIAALANDLTDRTIALSDGTVSNTIRIQYLTVSNAIWATVTNIGAGGNQAILQYTSPDITINSKVALKYKANDFSLWVNGIEVATDTSGVTFSANTLNTLQFDRGNGAQNFFGNTKDLQVYTKALSNAELIKLTTI